jgi:hypothetical protein
VRKLSDCRTTLGTLRAARSTLRKALSLRQQHRRIPCHMPAPWQLSMRPDSNSHHCRCLHTPVCSRSTTTSAVESTLGERTIDLAMRASPKKACETGRWAGVAPGQPSGKVGAPRILPHLPIGQSRHEMTLRPVPPLPYLPAGHRLITTPSTHADPDGHTRHVVNPVS